MEVFKSKESFSRKELLDFLKQSEPDLNEGTFGWRIYDLKKRDIIKPLQRGFYSISNKSKFKPTPSPELEKLAKKITEKYKDVKYCIWDTTWLNEFSQHQSTRQITIIETEKEFVEPLYFHLKESFSQNIFINPDEKAINFYITESSSPVVIKRLITRSPVAVVAAKTVKVTMPELEKILVDLYCDSKLFYFYQGPELGHIYENAVKKYTINFTKLFGYAARREQGKDFKIYFLNHTDHLVKNLYHD